MKKYVGTFSITVEAKEEDILTRISEEIVEVSKREDVTLTALTTSIIIIEDI